MRVHLIETVEHGTQTLCAGVQCDVSEDQAQTWIRAGRAISDELEPIPAPSVTPADPVIPAQAGIQGVELDSRLRGNDDGSGNDESVAAPEPEAPTEDAAPVKPAKTGKAK